MKAQYWFAAGFALAWILSRPRETSCCRRVAANVRLKAGEQLGQGVVTAGDVFGLWERSPALLDLLGVPDDA